VKRLDTGPLGVPGFRLLCGGQFASTIGDYCYAVALPWLVLSQHGGTVLLGIVLACYGVPRTILIPAGGVLADKLGSRRLMLLADGARAALVAVLTVLAARHIASLAALGPIAALIGAGEGLFIPASYAIMPSLLEGDQLAAGNALSIAAVQAGSLLGPVLGGALVAATHASTAAFGADAGSFVISGLTLALIRPAPASGTAAEQAPPPPGEGVLALLRRSRALQVLLVVVIAANLSSGGMGEVALPALAHARFGAAGYGALLACLAVGGIAGTLGAARTGGLRAPVVFASVMFLVGSLCVSAVPYLGGEAGAAASLCLVGACNGLGNVTVLTVMQKWVATGVLGRVMGVVMLCAFGSFPLSVAVAGVLVRHLGPVPFFPVAGALVAVAVLFGLTRREFRTLGATADAPPRDAVQAAEGSRR
jgi:MFS family permease